MPPEQTGTFSHPFLISFSGIDGAGKTTQIEYLVSYLRTHRLRVLQLSFWDHIAAWPGLRSKLGTKAVGIYPSPRVDGAFIPTNHKHIRRWYLTAVRSSLYVMDAIRLRYLLASQRFRDYDVVVFDRYIYDQLANLYSRSLSARIYITLLLKYTPRPDLAFIIDAQPPDAFVRKPEYPLDFLYKNRRAFLELRTMCPGLIIISGGTIEKTKSEIHAHLSKTRVAQLADDEESETQNERAVMRSVNSCRVQNEPTKVFEGPSKLCANESEAGDGIRKCATDFCPSYTYSQRGGKHRQGSDSNHQHTEQHKI